MTLLRCMSNGVWGHRCVLIKGRCLDWKDFELRVGVYLLELISK